MCVEGSRGGSMDGKQVMSSKSKYNIRQSLPFLEWQWRESDGEKEEDNKQHWRLDYYYYSPSESASEATAGEDGGGIGWQSRGGGRMEKPF